MTSSEKVQEFTLGYAANYLWTGRRFLVWPPLLAFVVAITFVLLCPPDVVPHMYSQQRVHRLVMNLDNTPEVLRGTLKRLPIDYVLATLETSDLSKVARVVVVPERGQVMVELPSSDFAKAHERLDEFLRKSYFAGRDGLKEEAVAILSRIEEARKGSQGKVLEADVAKTDAVASALQRYLVEGYGPLGGVTNQPESPPDRRALYVQVFVLIVFFGCLAIYLIVSQRRKPS